MPVMGGLLTVPRKPPKVSEKVRSYDNIAIDFRYVLHNSAENINQETHGDVVMEGDKYRLNILGITRIFDGKISRGTNFVSTTCLEVNIAFYAVEGLAFPDLGMNRSLK